MERCFHCHEPLPIGADYALGAGTERRRFCCPGCRAVAELIDAAVKDGAKLLTGGHAIDGPGYFYAPTVLADVPETARIRKVDPFGPVAVLRVASPVRPTVSAAPVTARPIPP